MLTTMQRAFRDAAHRSKMAEKQLMRRGPQPRQRGLAPGPKLGWRWTWQKAGSGPHTRRPFRPGAVKQLRR